MTEKIVVHRFGEGDDFQTLYINIIENENVSEVNIGEWHVAKDTKKKETDKSRLIVKVVSDDTFSILDLDSCAKKFKKINSFLGYSQLQTSVNELPNLLLRCPNDLVYKNSMLTEQVKPDNDDAQNCNVKNPLEYCLEKVKENNAKIMANINMLNRTLNYTQKKDIVELFNPTSLRSFPCEDCGKCFVYENGLRRHYVVRHSNSDGQQRWQFVWTCTECFQVWPQKDLALKHAKLCCKNDNTEWVQEIKASSVLQCEFCEKVYTNIPRLLRHLKTHTVKKNYECNPCEITFSCYKTAEQHWLSCLWLKTYYQFSLPKLHLCNACDRKFKNYDQLYNHRYKLDHFVPKLSINDGTNFLATLAFQCEICGQWFNTINQIHEHRNYYHPHYNNGIFHVTEVQNMSEG